MNNNTYQPEQCADCHQQQVSQWQQSDHAKAMAVANNKTVLADFNNVEVSHFSQTARFYKQGDEFFVSLSHEGKKQSFKVSYVFGHYPLQQYLIASEKGKYQVFPFSWDSRSKAAGGQRWYPVYQDEDIKAADRLHWQQPLQTWNGMCADCHSDGLTRNYQIETDTFKTAFDNINVGCLSCHGEIKPEHKNAQASTSTYNNQWLIAAGKATATWQGEKRDNRFMDTCFACHALRAPLTDGIDANTAFLDQFTPSFLEPNLYHADGQIKEEVYVYGSFLQSKMFAAGVNCLDCHDQHTMKLKVEGNGLCLQCHNPEVFEQKSHHQHLENSAGSQCVNCHMPDNRYMGVDDRRDHSFKIPRPDLSITYNTPNACVKCHDDKTNIWAKNALETWHGKAEPLNTSMQSFIKLQHGEPIAIEEHLALINDTKLNAIYRATAISLLANSTNNLPIEVVKPWIASSEPLIRLSIARMGTLIAEQARYQSFAVLLNDQYKAIRVAAANHLLSNNTIKLAHLQQAFQELISSNNINAWRGEGNLNNSMAHFAKGDIPSAINALKNAIKVDKHFEPSYINLAEIYRNLGDVKQEQQTFLQALKAAPQSAVIHYSYGLYQIRNQQHQAAINSFKTALTLAPDNQQYAYIYLLALDSVGKTKQALQMLKMQIRKYQQNPQMLQLGLSFAQKLQDANAYQTFAKYLQAMQQ